MELTKESVSLMEGKDGRYTPEYVWKHRRFFVFELSFYDIAYPS